MSIWLWLSMILTAVSLCLASWWLGRPLALASAPASSVLPLPLFIRMLWPWVDVLAPACRPFMSWRLRQNLERLLHRADIGAPWTAHHLCALQCVLALLAMALCVVLLRGSLSSGAVLACSLGSASVLAAWPVQRLKERVQQRKRLMAREFPFMLDMTTLCVEAGLNLHGALRQAARNGPAGPLRDDLRHTLSDIRAGVARMQALRHWAERCDLPALHHFVAAVAQADSSGMSLGPVLRAQADQRRTERFLRAEKLALEAPVKLMFPLIFCIFPCSFLIIAFPIAIKFLALVE